MKPFLLLLFMLVRTFGVSVQKPSGSYSDVDVSDYVLPEEFFPENDRDAFPVLQQIPDIDVSQYTLPDDFFPENDRDALPTRRFFNPRPSTKLTQRFDESPHHNKMETFRGMKNEGPIIEWKRKMRRKNLRTMWPLGDERGFIDHSCPYSHYSR